MLPFFLKRKRRCKRVLQTLLQQLWVLEQQFLHIPTTHLQLLSPSSSSFFAAMLLCSAAQPPCPLGVAQLVGGSTARSHSGEVSAAPSRAGCGRWPVLEFGAYGNGRTKCRGMAVAPSRSEAAGVTESGMFSQSDKDLSSSGLTVHSTIDDLDLDQLNALFAKVSFPCREKEKLLQALEHTQSLLWIQDTRSKQLIAFARATGDNVFNAIIWDVVVDPSYQGLGLGKVLMERLMAALVKMGISNIALYAEPNVVGFYQPLGFISDPDAIRAMAYSRRR